MPVPDQARQQRETPRRALFQERSGPRRSRHPMLSKPEKRIWEAFQVKPAPFAYAKARSLDHAITLLDGAADARVLAGGQSLVPALNMRLSTPSLLVDINGLRELGEISRHNGHTKIGALVRHVQAERSATVAQSAPLLARAIPHIAHPAILQSRYHRRVYRAGRSGRGIARLPAGARSRDRDHRASWATQRRGGRLFQRPV